MSRVLLPYSAMVSRPAGISADTLLLTRYTEIGHVGELVQSTRFASEHFNHVKSIVVARHTAERYSYSKVLIAFAWLAEIVGLPNGFGNILTTLLIELPHSRSQEYEGLYLFLLDRQERHQQSVLPAPLADKIGLKLSAKACFDPTAAPSCGSRLRFCSAVLTLALHRMFTRLGALEKSSGGLNVSFLNTHPASDERVKVCTSHQGLVMYHSLI